MKIFEIVNNLTKAKKPCAYLFYDEKNDMYNIKIRYDADENNVPMMFSPFIKKKNYNVDNLWSKKWVKERIVPSSRQNIGQILKANNMKEYNEFALLLLNHGKCSQDDFVIREIFDKEKIDLGKENLIGNIVKNARLTSKITQKELSEKTGIKQSNISRIENGDCIPTIESLNQIAKGLNKELNINIL